MNLKQKMYKKTQISIDAASLLLSVLFSTFLRHRAFIFPKTLGDFLFLSLVALLWFLAANECRLYRNRIYKKFPEEILFNVYTNLLFVVFLSAFLFLSKSSYSELFYFSQFISLHFGTSIMAKYVIRKRQHWAFEGGDLHDNIIIVGFNKTSIDFYNTIKRHLYYGFKCVGFIDDIKVQEQELISMNTIYLGSIYDLTAQLKKQSIDEVIIAIPSEQSQQISQCIDICDQFNVRVRLMPALQDLINKTEEIDNVGLVSVINLNELPLDKWQNKIFKNIFDVLFSILFFLGIGWWLFPLIALFIKISSKGPIIYKQERWGVNNQPIICYKFRTMQSSEVGNTFEQTSRNDPRVTAVGKFLRKFSFDELPQFWNVLKGEMSVVGPRPHPTPMNLASMQNVDNYLKRHVVKPGISGWAQINGCRGEVRTKEEMEQRVNFDLYYIHRWSFTLDVQIILQTLIKMLKDEDAY